MSMIKKMLKELADDKSTSAIYLSEIALLMEENEQLKDRLKATEKELENLTEYVEAYELKYFKRRR